MPRTDNSSSEIEEMATLYLSGYSGIDIAEEYGYHSSTVYRKLDSVGVDRRTEKETQVQKDTPRKLLDEGWLRKQYLLQQKNCPGIAEEIGCSSPTVRKWLKEYDIPVRDNREAQCTRTPSELRDGEKLRKLYSDNTMAEIAEMLSVCRQTVCNWINKHNIETREPADENPPRGPDHPSWKENYKKDVPYGKGWYSLRKDVLERDGGSCVVCGTSERAGVHHKISRRFVFHHPFMSLEEDANQMSNLVTLCPRHHAMEEAGTLDEEL